MFESAFPEYELWPNVKAVAHIKQLLPTLLYRVCLLLHIELILVNGHVTLWWAQNYVQKEMQGLFFFM